MRGPVVLHISSYVRAVRWVSNPVFALSSAVIALAMKLAASLDVRRDVSVSPAMAGSTHDDLYTPVARFGHIIGSLNQRLALASAGGLNDFRRDSAPDQKVPYPEGALQG